MNSLVEQFVDALPAGEWADVRVLSQVDGAMARRDWAILAEARWLRRDGVRAFIKCLVPAGMEAGKTTQQMTGPERLERLENRVRVLQECAGSLPVVEILDVRMMPSFGGLLVAMKHVEVLHERISSGRTGVELSIQVLETLRPSPSELSWHHFDVCSRNIGIDGSRCVFIDVDSLYLIENGRFDVTMPMWKPFRAPDDLQRAVNADLQDRRLELHTARAKLAFEILLVSAECTLGILESRRRLDEHELERWLREPRSISLGQLEFWRHVLKAAVERPDEVHLESVLDTLRELRLEEAEAQEVAMSPVAADSPDSGPSSASLKIQEVDSPIPSNTDRESEPPPEGAYEREMEMLAPLAALLRRDQLRGRALSDYRGALERLAFRHPEEIGVWRELLLVVLSYQRLVEAAREVCEEGLRHHPADSELNEWLRITTLYLRKAT